jgi:hypothetical protein
MKFVLYFSLQLLYFEIHFSLDKFFNKNRTFSIKFHENLFRGSRVVTDRQTDHMEKLQVKILDLPITKMTKIQRSIITLLVAYRFWVIFKLKCQNVHR